MAVYNWAADSGSTKSGTWSGTQGPGTNVSWEIGTAAEVFDNNTGTYYGAAGREGSGHYDMVETATATSMFPEAKTITSIVINLSWSLSQYMQLGSVSYVVYAYYSGGWQTIGSGTPSQGGNITYAGTITGVSGVRLYGYIQGKSFSAGSTLDIRLNECQAWGQKYWDSGLRVNTSTGVVAIGCETLNATHKLRVIKDSTVSGIPLLATGDANATGLRIRSGGTVKALPKVV